jgi:DNA-directed RNA polymerase subunit RPC12/RpoP
MAGAISVVCPSCGKKVTVRAELEGKKIRCKECKTVYPVTTGISKTASASQASAEAKKSMPHAGSPGGAIEEVDSNPYGITAHEEGYRCPVCANEMDSPEAIICLHCGFNTKTRETARTRHVHDTTGEDRFMWMLPAILCIIAIFVMILIWILYHFALPYWIFGDKFDEIMDKPGVGTRNKLAGDERLGQDSTLSYLFHYGVEIWLILGFIFLAYLCIRFAVYRLILHPDPPEREKTGTRLK